MLFQFIQCINQSAVFQVIRIPETSDETFDKLLAFGKAMGKVTVNCKVCQFHLYFNTVCLVIF